MSLNIANSIYVYGGTNSTATTAAATTTTWVSTTGYSNANYSPKHKYNIMGDDIEINGYFDTNIAVVLATINVFGWKYYEELLKQGVSFVDEIDKEIKKRYTLYLRDNKIESILE